MRTMWDRVCTGGRFRTPRHKEGTWEAVGTHTAPDVAYESLGVWNRTMEAQAGEISVFQIHCNSHGCGRWNSGYNLFELDSVRGSEFVRYEPQAETLNVAMGGINYGFSPQAFTAPTLHAGTATATTLTAGNVAASTVTTDSLSTGTFNLTSSLPGPQNLSFMAPQLQQNAQFCEAFGTSVSAHNSTFYCWWNTPTTLCLSGDVRWW